MVFWAPFKDISEGEMEKACFYYVLFRGTIITASAGMGLEKFEEWKTGFFFYLYLCIEYRVQL